MKASQFHFSNKSFVAVGPVMQQLDNLHIKLICKRRRQCSQSIVASSSRLTSRKFFSYWVRIIDHIHTGSRNMPLCFVTTTAWKRHWKKICAKLKASLNSSNLDRELIFSCSWILKDRIQVEFQEILED